MSSHCRSRCIRRVRPLGSMKCRLDAKYRDELAFRRHFGPKTHRQIYCFLMIVLKQNVNMQAMENNGSDTHYKGINNVASHPNINDTPLLSSLPVSLRLLKDYSSLTHLSAISPINGSQYLDNPSCASFHALNDVQSVTPTEARMMMIRRKRGRRMRRLKMRMMASRGVVRRADW